MKKNNTCRIYLVDPKTNTNVFIFITPPHRATNGLRAYHKRRRLWAAAGLSCKTKAGTKRTCQIERWCRMIGAKMEEKPFQE